MEKRESFTYFVDVGQQFVELLLAARLGGEWKRRILTTTIIYIISKYFCIAFALKKKKNIEKIKEIVLVKKKRRKMLSRNGRRIKTIQRAIDVPT